MTFRVGQKVVCVKPVDDLVRDRTYEILGVEMGYAGRLMVAVDATKFQGIQFYAFRFRPLIDRKAETDISIFTKMLTPAQEPACTSS